MSFLAKSVLDAGVGAGLNAAMQVAFSKFPTSATSSYVRYEPEGPTLLILFGLLANYDGNTPSGTLVGLQNYSLKFYPPNSIQGLERRADGAGSEDLSDLAENLTKSMRRLCSPEDTEDVKREITVIANFTIKGMIELRKTYEVHKTSDPKKCERVTGYIERGSTAIEAALNDGVDHFKDTPLDTAVRESYRKGRDITFLAQTILRLQQNNIPIELKHAYVTLLSKWVECKLLEFQAIKKQL